MASTYYVNLNNGYTSATSGTGTNIDPFNYYGMVNNLAAADDDFYLIRGQIDFTSGTSPDNLSFGTSGNTLSAWDIDLYGPWRIHNDTSMSISPANSFSKIYDSIIYMGNNASNAGTFGNISNSFIYNGYDGAYTDIGDPSGLNDLAVSVTDSVLVSTNITKTFDFEDNDLSATISNTVMATSAYVFDVDINVSGDNVITNKTDIESLIVSAGAPVTISFTNTTYGSILDVAPDWNSDLLYLFNLGASSAYGPSWTQQNAEVIDQGQIGAFYLGPISASPSADAIGLDLSAQDVTVVIDNPISVSAETDAPTWDNNLQLRLQLQQPTIIAQQDFTCDFIGTPLYDISPLDVTFTPIITLISGTNVLEYRWYYDRDSSATSADFTSAAPSTTFVLKTYTGEYDQTFSVLMEVDFSADGGSSGTCSAYKPDYVKLAGTRSPYRFGECRYINLTNFLPEYTRNNFQTFGMVETFERYLNNMYEGYCGNYTSAIDILERPDES